MPSPISVRKFLLGLAAVAASACHQSEEPSRPGALPAMPAAPVSPAPAASPGPSPSPASPAAPGLGGARPAATGPGATAATGAKIDVRWSFPALIPDSARGLVFPTYLAHLLGRPLDHPFPTDLVCVDVINPGPALSATLTVQLAVYGQDASLDLELGAGRTHRCLTPAFDLAKLYELRAPTPGRLEANLSAGGAVIDAAMQPLSISPVDEIAWQDGDITLDDMRTLASVFVTPADPKVDQLQRLAAAASVFGRFGNGEDAYERDPYLRSADLDAGTGTTEIVYLESGEPLAWTVSSVDGGDGVVDVYLFTPDQYDAWREGDSQEATEVWTGQGAGASARVSEATGEYVLVVFNAETYPTVTVTWSRSVTREDVAADTLQSIYAALQRLHTTYSSISSSFFLGFQHVRRPSEVLDALSANCLDGSLLFASVLELVGMNPVLVFKTGHVYVAVESAPGSGVIWPVETTMVGTSDFSDAFATAQAELSADSKNDPRFELVAVSDARAVGVLPLAQ
jgi:hypothetical protein